MRFQDHIREQLAAHAAAGLMRTPRLVSGPQGPEITVDGRRAICLCSNNYLGLADHPAIRAAAVAALSELGFGAAASRHISGSMELHVQAEARLARFTGRQRALFFATGYAANTGALQALADRDTLVFSDELNHASLIDGCRLSRARVLVYRHRDVEHLVRLMVAQRATARTALVVSESVFSMDGDLAPVAALREVCDRYDAALVVDEAHALGVLGPQGRGLCAREGALPDVLVGTLGKAFGAAGAFIAADAESIRLIENRARSYIFSTAPAPSLAAAALAATELVEAADDRRHQLYAHAARLRSGLAQLGYRVEGAQSPILPVLIGDPEATMALSARLLEHGVFVHGIRPPTVPKGTSRLRVTPMASHEPVHIERALEAFRLSQI